MQMVERVAPLKAVWNDQYAPEHRPTAVTRAAPRDSSQSSAHSASPRTSVV